MACTKQCVPFQGTAEQEAELKSVIAQLKDTQGSLMLVMQKAQGIYGYLPVEVQTMIAEGMDVPLEKVYGIATFYSMFSLFPKGRHRISVCLGTACYVKGSADILAEITKEIGIDAGECTADTKFSLDSCRCVGACGLAPVMVIDEDVHGRIVPAQVKGILAQYE
ncbi:MAG: NAD(P)H-dependent oxidoreductase subunit E [Planctomycetia bacterium]|nr:NAD(P)H-dependent oxidoreductase subunit E [Planctomycetia bacterium]